MDNIQDQELIFRQFQEACSDFQVPATRAAAEVILSQFRQLPNALSLCQYILEHSNLAMTQFQVALAIIDISVRNYSLYEHTQMMQLKSFLMEYCLQHPDLKKFVVDQLVLGVAVLTKRSLFDVSDQDRGSILVHLNQLLGMEAENAQVLGLALGNAYIDQFSNVKKSSIVGMSWEYHQKCKMFFETDVLLKLFEMALTKIQSDQLNIQSELMALFEKILHWEFANDLLPGTFAKTDDLDDEFDKEDGPSLVKKTYSIFPKTWRSVIGDPQVVVMFFMAYFMVQSDDQLAHRCRQCLIQLSGFQQDFFDNDMEAIKAYASTLMHGILKMMNNITVFGTSPDALSEQGPQMLGTIQMIRRLLENIKLVTLCSIPEFFDFLNQVGLVTVSCLGATVTDVDEGWISEACDECLQTWVHMADLVQPSDPRSEDPKAGLAPEQSQHLVQYMHHVAYNIVDSYINTRLERAKLVIDDEEEEDEIDASFKDWETFADQLTCIGALGRLNPQPCLSKLQQLASERFATFKTYFNGSGADEHQLGFLHEQLHWIILISAHILADSGKGEQPMIPDSLMHLSASQSQDQNQVVSISKLFLELLGFTSSFGSNTVEASNCSPRVAETLVWYMERWSKTYLLIDENEYGHMSPSIAKAFGRPGPSDGHGMEIVDFFIEQMKVNFILWNADPDVLNQLVKWLHTCGTSNNLKRGLLQSARFPDLVQFLTQNVDQLPEALHNSLIQTAATISSGAPDEATRNNYLNLMFTMIQERLGSVLHRPDFQQRYQDGQIVNNVINALEMFDGLALACQYNNTVTIFQFCSRFFESFVQLMNIYKSVPEVQLAILQLFSDLANRLDFGLLGDKEKEMLFSTMMETLRLFGASNYGKKRMHSQEEEEDKPYADIAIVLVMLSNVMASGLEDFSQKEQGQISGKIAQVVLFGINIVIPMIDLEMLKIPSLCQQYIQLISHLIEVFPEKLAGLPGPLFNNLIASLEYGIKHDISDVNIATLRAVTPLSMWAYNQQLAGANIDLFKPALEQLLTELLKSLLFQHLDTNVIDAASDALLALILTRRDTFMAFANKVISDQTSGIQLRLSEAFQKLDQSITQTNSAMFKEALLVFLMNVRAVLRTQ